MEKTLSLVLACALLIVAGVSILQSRQADERIQSLTQELLEEMDQTQEQNSRIAQEIVEQMEAMALALEENDAMALHDAALRLETTVELCADDEFEQDAALYEYQRIAEYFLKAPADDLTLCFDEGLRARFAGRLRDCAVVELNGDNTARLELLNHLAQQKAFRD